MFSNRYFKSGSSTSDKRGFSKATSELTRTHCHFRQPLLDLDFRKYCIISPFKWSFKKVTQNAYQKTLSIWNNSTSSPAPLLKKVPYSRSHRKASRWVLSLSPEKETSVELHCAHCLRSNWVAAPASVAGWPQKSCDITRAKKQPSTSGKKQPTVFKYLSVNFRKLTLLIKISKVFLHLSFVLCVQSTQNNEVQLHDCNVEMLEQHQIGNNSTSTGKLTPKFQSLYSQHLINLPETQNPGVPTLCSMF